MSNVFGKPNMIGVGGTSTITSVSSSTLLPTAPMSVVTTSDLGVRAGEIVTIWDCGTAVVNGTWEAQDVVPVGSGQRIYLKGLTGTATGGLGTVRREAYVDPIVTPSPGQPVKAEDMLVAFQTVASMVNDLLKRARLFVSVESHGVFSSAVNLRLGKPGKTIPIITASGTPVLVVVRGEHGLSPGDSVDISGNTNANGDAWIVATTPSASTFTLYGSTSGSGVAGGTVSVNARVGYGGTFSTFKNLTNVWSGGSDGSYVSPNGDGVFFYSSNSVSIVPFWIGWEIDLPHGALISAAQVAYKPATPHVGIPAVVPSLSVYRIEITANAATTAPVPLLLGTVAESNTGSIPAYQSSHLLSCGTITNGHVDRTRYRYLAIFELESGLNALEGTRIFGARVFYSTRLMDVT